MLPIEYKSLLRPQLYVLQSYNQPKGYFDILVYTDHDAAPAAHVSDKGTVFTWC